MSDINTIKTKLDTDNQKWVISEKEFNDNFGKLDQTDYKKISEWLEAKDQQFLTLLQKPIFENIQKKNLLSKQSLSVNEIKTVKLFFMSYGMNANRGGERQKSNEQKMAEMYMNQQWIFYWLWQEWWNEFKKWFKWNIFNFNKSKGKDITYPAWPINMNHPDIKRLNGEQLQITQQIEKVQKDNYNNIQQGMKDIENKEIATRPLSKKLEELKNKNTLDVLDELASAPNGILYNDNIKEMTYNEKEKIQKIIENVFSNPSVNSTQVMNYVWKFHCSLWDEKRSNKTWEKVEWLPIRTNNQVGMRIEIINTCYQLAQAKWFGELQSNPETAKRSLVKLCNILTWRFNSTGKGRMMQEDNDKKFNNPELARGILESLMQINGTIDKISPVDILKDDPSLKNKECWIFVAEISQNIPRPLSWEFGILDLVSVDEKIKISQLSATLQARAIVLKKISEKIKSDQKKVPFESSYIQELKNLWTNEAKAQQVKFKTQKENFKKEIEKVDFWTSGFEKSAQEYGLQWADTDIFNLYRDFAVNSFWAGELSDEVDDQVMWYAKMWAMIWWTIVTMMIFPPAWVGYLWSAIAVWVTSTVLTQVLYNKMNYNSFTEWAVDIWSQFVFDTATAFLGMKVFWPIIQKVPWFFNNVKNITSNVWITLFDVGIWSSVEWMRQKWFNELFDKQEGVDIMQMIRLWWVMATVFLMVSWWFHVKLPVDDMLRHLKANDPKLNPNGFKNLNISEIDYQNSIKLLELKSNALKDVDVINKISNKEYNKISNKSDFFTNIENWDYTKSGKPKQNFDLNWKNPNFFKENPNILQEYYIKEVLPWMNETDIIKQKIMQDIVNNFWWEIKNAPLKWIDNPSRAIEKIIEYDGDVNKLLDISRWTLIYDNIDDIYKAFGMLLQHPDVTSVFVKDNFKRKTWYRDINLAITTHTWKVFELQINTKNLLESKEKWLTIPKEYIINKTYDIEKNPKNNFYWDIIDKINKNENIFNNFDENINKIINSRLEKKAIDQQKSHKYIDLPDILNNINWHKLYELTRELENVLDIQKNPYKEMPERLNWFTYEAIHSYNQKISNYSNLLYDYAYSISK